MAWITESNNSNDLSNSLTTSDSFSDLNNFEQNEQGISFNDTEVTLNGYQEFEENLDFTENGTELFENGNEIRMISDTIIALQTVLVKYQARLKAHNEATKEIEVLKAKVSQLEETNETLNTNIQEISKRESQSVLDNCVALEERDEARATILTIQTALNKSVKERDVARQQLKNIYEFNKRITASVNQGLKSSVLSENVLDTLNASESVEERGAYIESTSSSDEVRDLGPPPNNIEQTYYDRPYKRKIINHLRHSSEPQTIANNNYPAHIKKSRDSLPKLMTSTGKTALTYYRGIRHNLIALNKKFVADLVLSEPRQVPNEVMVFYEYSRTEQIINKKMEELFAGYQLSSYMGRDNRFTPNVYHFWFWREFSPCCPVCGTRFKYNYKPFDLKAHSNTTHYLIDENDINIGKNIVSVVFHPINKKKIQLNV